VLWLERGKMTELWAMFDALSMLRQIGMIPGQPSANAVARAAWWLRSRS
jgi:hypothetical protein